LTAADPAEAFGAEAHKHAASVPLNANALAIFIGDVCPCLSVDRFDIAANPLSARSSGDPARFGLDIMRICA
jgi:hypothetical protein